MWKDVWNLRNVSNLGTFVGSAEVFHPPSPIYSPQISSLSEGEDRIGRFEVHVLIFKLLRMHQELFHQENLAFVAKALGSVHLKSVGGAGKWGGGGACKFRIGFGGGQVNSALDLGGSCKFRIRGKKPVTLHFSVSVQYSTGTPFRYCVEGGGGVKGEVASGSAPPVWI